MSISPRTCRLALATVLLAAVVCLVSLAEKLREPFGTIAGSDDVEWLDALCRDRGIELVANQNCFGHMERWLCHAEYRDRAEAPDGWEPRWGGRRPPSVLAPTPENAEFALALLRELLPHFTSRRVNIGCDETFELGLGASREAVAAHGRGRVYLDHLQLG